MADAQEKSEQLRADYHVTFNSEAGQRVLDDLKAICFYNTTTINEMPHVMAYNEGARSVVLHISTRLKLTENKVKELQNDRG
jgi:hypothetical protein